jgi:hypothetical protein
VFEHQWDGEPIKLDGSTPYHNPAGNILTFNNIEYFISDLSINGASSSIVTLGNPDIRYINNDSAYSTLHLTHQIPAGRYQGIRFIFGIDSTRNKSNLFPNSPEKNMFWPENMGGGYHYMKIDGKWKNQGESTDQPFGLHMGALKITNEDGNSRTYHKFFPVWVARNIEIKQHEITNVKVVMNVKQWMDYPKVWDFNVMGGEIMSRERAMDSLRRNGQYNYQLFK